MKTLSVVSLKGGAGKTTIALNLAINAHVKGQNVLVADIDPQRSASQALKLRTGDGPQWVSTTGKKLHCVKSSAELDRRDFFIVDTPAFSVDDAVYAINMSDIVLMVLRPNYFDLAAAAMTVRIAAQLNKPLFSVINQALPAYGDGPHRSVKNAFEVLEMLKLTLPAPVIHARAAFQRAAEIGLSVDEYRPLPEAALEISALERQLAVWLATPRHIHAAPARMRGTLVGSAIAC